MLVSATHRMSQEARFKVGDKVRWVRAVASPEKKNAVGVIITVIPNDANLEEFAIYAIYDIEFSFGIATLYGTPIDALH